MVGGGVFLSLAAATPKIAIIGPSPNIAMSTTTSTIGKTTEQILIQQQQQKNIIETIIPTTCPPAFDDEF